MTAEELIRGFQSELHQKDGPQITDSDDILYFLNKAQDNFILDKFSGKRSSAEGFEQSQDLIDDLRNVYRKDISINAIYALTNASIHGIEVDSIFLPSDYMHLVTARAVNLVSTEVSGSERENLEWELSTITDGDGNDYSKRVPRSDQAWKEKRAPIRYSQSQSVYELLDDPFHRPSYKTPLCDINNDRLNVYASPHYIVDKVIINYIRQPIEICLDDGSGNSNTSELPEMLHQEIVERAAMLFLRNYPQSSNEQS